MRLSRSKELIIGWYLRLWFRIDYRILGNGWEGIFYAHVVRPQFRPVFRIIADRRQKSQTMAGQWQIPDIIGNTWLPQEARNHNCFRALQFKTLFNEAAYPTCVVSNPADNADHHRFPMSTYRCTTRRTCSKRGLS